jgi:MFS family permease
MLVEAARDILDGRRDQTVGSLFSSVSPVLAPLIGAGILAGIGIAIGFVLLIVPGLYLLTIWAVLVPVIVLERTGVFPSFGRSRQLVKGHGWQVFGVLVVLFLLFLVIRVLVAAIIGGIADTFAGFALADLIVNLLTVPISALAASVIYFELKRLHGEPIPGAAPGGALDTAASGVAPEASGGTSTPPAAAPDSGRAAAPQPGSPPPAAPPPGGSRPAGDDPGPQSSRRQAPPNA